MQPKGFKGRYFSLAAILAVSASVSLNAQSVAMSSYDVHTASDKEVQSEEEESPLVETVSKESDSSSSVFDLGILTVTSVKPHSDELKAAASYDIYTADDILTSKSDTLYEFLNQHTQITTMPSFGNPFTQRLDLRGFGIENGHQNIVVTIDGRRLNNIDQLPQMLSVIPIDSVEKIEIVKGSGAALFGDNATAGVINITTRQYEGLYAKLMAGNNNVSHMSAGGGYGNEYFRISAFANQEKSGGVRKVDAKGNLDENSKQDTIARVALYPIDVLELRLATSKSDIQAKYASAQTKGEFEKNPTALGSAGSSSEVRLDSISTEYGLTFRPNDAVEFTVDGSGEAKENENVTYSYTSEYDYKTLRTTLLYKNPVADLLVGFDRFDGTREGASDETTKYNEGQFAQLSKEMDSHTFTASTRTESVTYTYDPTSGTKLEKDTDLDAYEVGYNYRFDDRSSIFVNYGKSFKAPNIDDFFTTNWVYNAITSSYDPTTSFNGFMDPTTVKTLNVGFSRISESNKLKVTLFDSRLENEIFLSDFSLFNTFGTNTNIDESSKRGVELYDKYLVSEQLYALLNYTYVDATIEKESEANGAYEGNTLTGTSQHTATLGVGYTPDHASKVILTHKYRSEAYALNDIGNDFARQPAYHSTDLTGTYAYGDFELFLNVTNLFEHKNGLYVIKRAPNADYTAVDESIAVYPTDFTRQINLGVTARF